ncbi:hypothetical protein TSOC_000784, partial [Tetrabaena socialis]
VCSNASGRPGHGTLVRVAAYTMWSGDLWGLRRTLLPFIQWHTQAGICRYYIAYPGRDERTVTMLQAIKSVRLIFSQPPFATPERFREWREYASQDEWGQKPGNWRQMAKQGFAGNIACAMAQDENYNWIAHIDADELLVPGISLAADLAAVPRWVASIIISNNEAVAESIDTLNKYEQITLFKNHERFSPNGTGDLQWRFTLGTQGSYYQVYYNGKGIGRTDGGPLSMWGVHAFTGPDDNAWRHPVENPNGTFLAVEWSDTMLLHLSYTSWQDLMGKAARACPPEYRAAAKANDRDKVNECFCLTFDMDAYIAAVQGPQAARHFWVTNALFSEGAVRLDGSTQECRVYRNVRELKRLLIKDKLNVRVTAVQQALRGHEVGIRALARRMGINPAGEGGGGAAIPLTTTVRRRGRRRQRLR